MSTLGRCAISQHPDRHRIEMLRLGGSGLDALSRKFAVHRDCLWRHMRKRVTDEARAGNLRLGHALQVLLQDSKKNDHLSMHNNWILGTPQIGTTG